MGKKSPFVEDLKKFTVMLKELFHGFMHEITNNPRQNDVRF